MSIEYIPSTANVIKSVPKSADAPYGVIDVDVVAPGRKRIVTLGGEFTYMAQFANHYIKLIKQLLTEANAADCDVYGVYYTFGSRKADVERREIFARAGRMIAPENHWRQMLTHAERLEHMENTEPVPGYLEPLYNALIKPILIDDAGNVRDAKTVKQLAEELRFYTHSHGSAVLYQLADIMADKMKQMNFTAEQIRDIQKQIVAVQHGPVSPLEHSRFTTLSFMSASDTTSRMYNTFYEYAHNNSENMYPSYFSQWGINLFMAGQFRETPGKEHDDLGLTAYIHKQLTDDGRVIHSAERNAILNSVRTNSNDVRTLVSGDGVDFDELARNGQWFYELMLRDTKSQTTQNPKPDYQR